MIEGERKMDLKIKDVADLLNVSEMTIRRWLSKGKIPAYKINHQYRFSREEIEDWVMSCKTDSLFKESEPQKIALNGEKAEKIIGKVGVHKFCLYRALHKGLVLRGVEGATKEEVIRNSMKEIAGSLNLDAAILTDLLLDRERLMPTGLNHGLAVPHTRDFLLQEAFDVVFVVYPKKPIEYGSLDGKPVHTLFFLFACEDKRHLHLLAKLAHLVNHSETREWFQTKPDKEDLLARIKNWESSIRQLAGDTP